MTIPLRGIEMLPALAAAGLALLHVHAAAARDCGGACGEDAACASEQAICLMDAGKHWPAIEILKELRTAHPQDGVLARTLALAYIGTGNHVWARKVLLEHLASSPEDMETRSWLIWLLIQDGDTELAQKLLDETEAPEQGPMAERLELLSLALAKLAGDGNAGQELADIGGKGQDLFPEDVALYESMRAELTGNPGGFLAARVLLSGGYTTNAVQSAPQDVGTGQGKAGAPVTSVDLVLRLEPWTSPLVRPLAEARAKGFLPTSADTRGFGYLSLGGRAGLEVGRIDGLRGRLLYGYELLGILDEGWYMTAHRIELELDILPELQVFGGFGRRIYEHLPRTRWEVDLGVALVLPLPGGWNLTWLAAGRLQIARHEAFDERGLTGLARLRVPLPRDFMIKLRAMVLLDVFPRSADYYDQDRDRSDLMLRLEIGAWSPSLHGIRIGVTYAASRRWSTVEQTIDNFNFADHRFLLELRWEGSLDPTLPSKAKVGKDHIALPYGLDGGGDTGLDRVQDLLRQEDSARRGSMCVQ